MMHDDLLAYIRTIFSEIVRVRYWHHIQEGKLPRLSFSAQFLLYSIDVALDDVYNKKNPDSCSVDWDCVEDAILKNENFILQVLSFLDRNSPSWLTRFRYLYGWINARRNKRAVYILTR